MLCHHVSHLGIKFRIGTTGGTPITEKNSGVTARIGGKPGIEARSGL